MDRGWHATNSLYSYTVCTQLSQRTYTAVCQGSQLCLRAAHFSTASTDSIYDYRSTVPATVANLFPIIAAITHWPKLPEDLPRPAVNKNCARKNGTAQSFYASALPANG